MEAHPPTFSYKLSRFEYLISLIIERAAYDHRQLDVKEAAPFVRLSSTVLNQLIPHYKPYITYLVEMGILDVDGQYQPGHNCRGYRVAEAYQSKIVASTITEQRDWRLIRNHTQRKAELQRVAQTQYAKQISDLAELEFDKEAALSLTEKCHQRDSVAAKTAKQHRTALNEYNARVAMIERFMDPNSVCTVDEAGHRLHTKLTNLWSSLRQFITFQGQRLVSVDLSCSQPCLATILLRPDFYYGPSNSERLTLSQLPADVQKLVRKIPSQIQRMFVGASQEAYIIKPHLASAQLVHLDSTERLGVAANAVNTATNGAEEHGLLGSYLLFDTKYQAKCTSYSLMLEFSPNLVNLPSEEKAALTDNAAFRQEIELYNESLEQGRFYEVLGEQISARSEQPAPTRQKLKEGVLSTLYSDNNDKRRFVVEARRNFQSIFPRIYGVFEELKAWAHRDLPVLLQGIEAELFLNRIAKRISQERPDLPLFTLHDSIIVPDGHQDYVEVVMGEEIGRATGIHPHFKQEKWVSVETVVS